MNSRLVFKDHLEIISAGLLRIFQNRLLRKLLIAIYIFFIKPHLDYGDIVCDRVYNASFYRKLHLIQYNDALAITGPIRKISKEKLYQELCSESLQQRRWYEKLCYNHQIIKEQSQNYLFRVIFK